MSHLITSPRVPLSPAADLPRARTAPDRYAPGARRAYETGLCLMQAGPIVGEREPMTVRGHVASPIGCCIALRGQLQPDASLSALLAPRTHPDNYD